MLGSLVGMGWGGHLSCIREEEGNMGFQRPLCLSQASKKSAPTPLKASVSCGGEAPWEEGGEELQAESDTELRA